MKNNSLRDSGLIMGSVIGLLTVVGLAVALVWNSGLPIVYKENPKQAVTKVIPLTSQWAVSPAAVTLKKALNQPPKGWEGKGNILETPQTPYPFSCAADGINPVLSYAKNFKSNGSEVQVMLTAYTAGLAEAGVQDKLKRAVTCGGGTYSRYKISGYDDGYQINVSTSGQNTKTIMFRHGDVVAYVIGDAGSQTVSTSSKDMYEHLSQLMRDVCATPKYSGTELSRSLFSGEDFKGYYTTAQAKIPSVLIPDVPTDADYSAVAIGSPTTKLKSLDLPTQPTAYPVWPLLPKEVKKPKVPEVPDKEAPTEKDYEKLTKDSTGPGCGWSFTGSTSPVFDQPKADAQNKSAVDVTTKELQDEATQWQKDVLSYWEDYAKYQKQSPKWNKYTENVAKVKSAWAKIANDWDAYYTAKANWDQQVAIRDSFITAQKNAKSNYENQIQVCKAWDVKQKELAQKRKEEERKRKEEEERKKREEEQNPPTPTATADPSESVTPTATTPTPTTTAPPTEPAPNCPAVRPSILDQTPPTVGPEPSKPADPRPADKRD